MSTPERTPERDAAIEAMLPLVEEHGWSMAALRRALAEPDDASLLFPGGTTDLIETFSDLADRQMEAAAAETDMSELGLTRRVRAVIAIRFAQQRPNRDAIRRALAILALPGSGVLAARITARTVDSIWHAAGDRSADFSWYTKRAILAAVYSATLIYWLRDHSEDAADTLAFLDRRLQGIGRIGKLRARLDRMITRFSPAMT
jgi:ubiquinone biosynthesis protein COQ9